MIDVVLSKGGAKGMIRSRQCPVVQFSSPKNYKIVVNV